MSAIEDSATMSFPLPTEYADPFRRFVFILNDLNRAQLARSFNTNSARLFLAGYFSRLEYREDLLECFRMLPIVPFTPCDEAFQNNEMEQNLTLDELRSFLDLLWELKRNLVEGRVDATARWDIVRLFLSLVGPRQDLLSRVLYYAYPPHDGSFTREEIPDDATEIPDANDMYFTEYLIIAMIFGPKAKMEDDEYDLYNSLWNKVFTRIQEGEYGVNESIETYRKFSEVFSRFEDLKRLLEEVPWLHTATPAMDHNSNA